MMVTPHLCSECGEPAEGTIDSVPCVAQFQGFDEDGETEYSGSTDVNWDCQGPMLDPDGNIQVVCSQGHVWPVQIEY